MKKAFLLLAFNFVGLTSFAQWQTGANNLLYTTTGNVTIGASTVQGQYDASGRALEVTSATGSYLNLKAGSDSIFLSNNAQYASGFYLPSTKNFSFFINDLYIPALQLQPNGNVSIGRNGGPAAYKLAVAGKIIAEELKVQLQAQWPDYVFSAYYKLPSLEEVEQHIKDNGHLANMPSATEVNCDGFEVGELTRLQQEKIEELTLYIIDLNKKLQLQEKRMQALEAKINN